MKKSYTLKSVIVEEGDISDIDKPLELREIEKREVMDFTDGDLERGLQESIELACKEGNYYYRGICKHTGDLKFIWGLCVTEGTAMGVPWLLSSKDFTPDIDFIRKSKEVVQRDMFESGVKVISNYIHKDNTKSIKWLKWLGFSFTPHPYLDSYYQFYKYKE
jgi:hypothetical protein